MKRHSVILACLAIGLLISMGVVQLGVCEDECLSGFTGFVFEVVGLDTLPVDNATVVVESVEPGITDTTYTASDGWYCTTNNLAEGWYTVTAYKTPKVSEPEVVEHDGQNPTFVPNLYVN